MNKYTRLIKGYPYDKPKFEQTIEKSTQFYVDIQAFLAKFPEHFDLDKARGQQLDILGEWIGRNRYLPTPISGVFFSFDDPELGFDQGNWLGRFDSETGLSALDDDTYRIILKAQIAANNWNGTNESLSELLKLFFSDQYKIFYRDNQDMTMEIAVVDGVMPALLLSFLLTMDIPFKPAGVRIKYFITSQKDAPLFGFDIENEYIAGFDTGLFGKVYTEGKLYG